MRDIWPFVWPVMLVVIQLVQGLVILSFRSWKKEILDAVRINRLEQEKDLLTRDYATKADVDQRVQLAHRMDAGFADIRARVDAVKQHLPAAR